MEKPIDIVRRSTVEMVVEALRDRLIKGRFPPGARLTELALADELNIARSTVRTALIELEKDDLVVRNPYVGWSVPEITPTVISEIYTLRGALEELAARIVAKNIDDAKRETLNEAFSALVRAERGDAGTDRPSADLNFHRTIVDLSGHGRLAAQYAALIHKMEWIYRWSENQSPSRIDLIEWHRPILDALLGGDGKAAEAAIRRNYEIASDEDIADLSSKLANTNHEKSKAGGKK